MLRYRRQTLTFMLRLILFTLLILALWNPELPIGSEPSDIYIVIDDSLSMPDNSQKLISTHLIKNFNLLPQGSRITLLRYANHVTIEFPLTEWDNSNIDDLFTQKTLSRRHALDRTGTNTAAAIRQVLHMASAQKNSSIILISDGQDTEGDVAQALKEAGKARIPIISIPLEPNTPNTSGHDSWVETFHIPQHGAVGQSMPITISVKGFNQNKQTIRLLLNKQQHRKTEFLLSPDGEWKHRWWITPDKTGTLRVDAILEDNEENNSPQQHRQSLANISGNKPVLYVAKQNTSALLSVIRNNNINVRYSSTANFPDQLNELLNYSAIIFDDIAISDLPDSRWKILETVVQDNGIGLLVLGGEHSFSQGGYRHSRLESFLPVTAESRSQQTPAAILFLIDTSGSMNKKSEFIGELKNIKGANNYIELARQAVIETSTHLVSSDNIGLMTFDIQAHQRLPIDHYANPEKAIEKAWQYKTSGGTQLLTALKSANDALAHTTNKTRLLVLLTDSFIENTAMDSITRDLKNNNIQLITLVTGTAKNIKILKELSHNTGGQLLRVKNVFSLPKLMRQQLEQHRLPIERGNIAVIAEQVLPFYNSINWPTITAYNVTRAKPEASVYLRSDRNDPLMAFQQSGNGRVIAMPGGLQDWSTSWMNRNSFISNMIKWLGIQYNPRLYTQATFKSGTLSIDVEALSVDLDWLDNKTLENQPATVSIKDPSGMRTQHKLTQIAPGHFTAQLPINQEGRYTTHINVSGQHANFDTLYTATKELMPRARSQENKQASSREYFLNLQKEGLITVWLPTDKTAPLALTKGTTDGRTLFLLAALLCYLFLIAHQRGFSARIYRSIKRQYNDPI